MILPASAHLCPPVRTLVRFALALLLLPAAAHAQITLSGGNPFFNVNLGSAPQVNALTFAIPSGTTVGRLQVLTDGVTGADFQDSGASTCAVKTYSSATTCSVSVKFNPLAAGPRPGAVAFYDGSGKPLAVTPLIGIGSASQVVYSVAAPTFFPLTNVPNLYATLIDAWGNVFVASYADLANDKNSGSIIEYPNKGAGALYNSPVTIASGINQVAGAVVDGAGNIFVTSFANAAGAPNSGSVLEIPKNYNAYGPPVTIATGLSFPYGIAIDLYQTLFVTSAFNSSFGANSGAIYKIPPTGTSTNITHGAPVAIVTGISDPEGIAVDVTDNVYFTSFASSSGAPGTGAILKAAPGSTGSPYAAPVTILAGQNYPAALALAPSGNIVFVNECVPAFTDHSGSIIEVSPAGGAPTTLASGLSFPLAISFDGFGDILFNNNYTQLEAWVRAFPPSFSFATTAQGATSSDSPQIVSLESFGNLPLYFNSLTFPADFSQKSVPGACAPGALNGSCLLDVNFSPITAVPIGSSKALSETVNITSNTLNGNHVLSQIAVTGTETGSAKFPPTVTMSAPTPSTVLGGTNTVKAAVTTTAAGAPAPTGTVTFSNGSNPLGAVPLTGGSASYSVPLLLAGPYTVTGNYSGDTNFSSAVAAYNGTVSQGTAKIKVVAPSNPGAVGATVPLTATVTGLPGVAAPTGTVAFSAGGATLATVNLNSGMAVYSLLLTQIGTSVTGAYSGDSNYLSATGTVTVTATKATPTVQVTAASNTAYVGSPDLLTATVSGVANGPTPTGNVAFLAGSTTLATVPLSGGVATYSFIPNTGGSFTITAKYAGDSTYNTASGTVSGATQFVPTVTISAASNQGTIGKADLLTAVVKVPSGQPAPTGTVAFYDSAYSSAYPYSLLEQTLLCTVKLSGSMATCTDTPAAYSTHQINAAYSGDANYPAATSPQSPLNVALLPGPPLTITFWRGSTALNEVFTLTGAAGFPAPTGAIITSFADPNGGNDTSTVSIANGVGNAVDFLGQNSSLTTVPVRIELYTGDNVYSGWGNKDCTYQTCPSYTAAVTPSPTTVALSPAFNPAPVGISQTVTANVTSWQYGLTPTGSVSFYNGSTLIGTTKLPAPGDNSPNNNTASFNYTFSPLGSTDSLKATYTGDANNAGSSATVTVPIEYAPAFTITNAGINPATHKGQFTAKATGVSGQPTPTGSVTFVAYTSNSAKYAPQTIGPVPLAGGTASISATMNLNYSLISATYSGDKIYGANGANGTITLTSGNN